MISDIADIEVLFRKYGLWIIMTLVMLVVYCLVTYYTK